MALAEWGLKHVCTSCHCRFYDLHRQPVVCPKCDAPFDPDVLFKTRKGRSAQTATEKVVPLRLEGDFEAEALDLEDVEDLEGDLAPPDDELLEAIVEEDPLEEVIEEADKI